MRLMLLARAIGLLLIFDILLLSLVQGLFPVITPREFAVFDGMGVAAVVIVTLFGKLVILFWSERKKES